MITEGGEGTGRRVREEWITPNVQVVLMEAQPGAEMVRVACPDYQVWVHLQGAWQEQMGEGRRGAVVLRCADVAEYLPVTPASRVSLTPSLSLGVRIFAAGPMFTTIDSGGPTPRDADRKVSLRRALWRLGIGMVNGERDDMVLDEVMAMALSGDRLGLGSGGAGKPPHWLVRTRDRIAAEPDRWTIAELAEVESVSATHLAHAFREHFGESAAGFRKAMRVGRAIGAMVDGEKPSQAAHSVGFYDEAHFSRQAKEVCGLSLRELRRALRT